MTRLLDWLELQIMLAALWLWGHWLPFTDEMCRAVLTALMRRAIRRHGGEVPG